MEIIVGTFMQSKKMFNKSVTKGAKNIPYTLREHKERS